ncbi:MAG: LysM peptidoglycan-binding domain-containing protein [Hyphomicrobiaceae bacterium]
MPLVLRQVVLALPLALAWSIYAVFALPHDRGELGRETDVVLAAVTPTSAEPRHLAAIPPSGLDGGRRSADPSRPNQSSFQLAQANEDASAGFFEWFDSFRERYTEEVVPRLRRGGGLADPRDAQAPATERPNDAEPREAGAPGEHDVSDPAEATDTGLFGRFTSWFNDTVRGYRQQVVPRLTGGAPGGPERDMDGNVDPAAVRAAEADGDRRADDTDPRLSAERERQQRAAEERARAERARADRLAREAEARRVADERLRAEERARADTQRLAEEAERARVAEIERVERERRDRQRAEEQRQAEAQRAEEEAAEFRRRAEQERDAVRERRAEMERRLAERAEIERQRAEEADRRAQLANADLSARKRDITDRMSRLRALDGDVAAMLGRVEQVERLFSGEVQRLPSLRSQIASARSKLSQQPPAASEPRVRDLWLDLSRDIAEAEQRLADSARSLQSGASATTALRVEISQARAQSRAALAQAEQARLRLDRAATASEFTAQLPAFERAAQAIEEAEDKAARALDQLSTPERAPAFDLTDFEERLSGLVRLPSRRPDIGDRNASDQSRGVIAPPGTALPEAANREARALPPPPQRAAGREDQTPRQPPTARITVSERPAGPRDAREQPMRERAFAVATPPSARGGSDAQSTGTRSREVGPDARPARGEQASASRDALATPGRRGAVVRLVRRTRAKVSRARRWAAHCARAGVRVSVPGTYVVKRGDSLWRIARWHYGRGAAYPRIVRANRRKIRVARLIYPCQRFVIPRR